MHGRRAFFSLYDKNTYFCLLSLAYAQPRESAMFTHTMPDHYQLVPPVHAAQALPIEPASEYTEMPPRPLTGAEPAPGSEGIYARIPAVPSRAVPAPTALKSSASLSACK